MQGFPGTAPAPVCADLRAFHDPLPAMASVSGSRIRAIFLWIAAFLVMVAAGRYQRLTGPTYPLGGSATIGGVEIQYEFLRSETTDRDARVALPIVFDGQGGVLHWKRYGTDDAWTAVPMTPRGDSLVAFLPKQPAAGKLAYFLDVSAPDGTVPIAADDPVIIRFKGPVPLPVLLAHVLAMFIAMMIAVRAAFEVIVNREGGRRLALVALVLMTIGGLVLGPIVQKYAFGAYWTGFPWGYDLTDNKTLLMWIAWALATGAYYTANASVRRIRRAIVIVAAMVMLGVYLIPHSMGGSQLDYSKVDEGVHPADAIGTGD